MTIAGWNETSAEVVRVTPRDPASVIFYAGGEERLRIARDGFYVDGVPVQQSAEHARKVYMAFLKWLRYHGMAV